MAQIGGVNATRREVQGIGPSVDPRAFGAGVASALQSFGAELGDLARTGSALEAANTSLGEAYKMRQERIQSGQLRADLIRLDNEMSRELSERYDALPPGAPGFTDETLSWANSRLDQFRQRVPEQLRSTFEPLIESIAQEKTTSAFRLQVSAENAEFTKTVNSLITSATEEMLAAPFSDIDEVEAVWLEDITEILKDSPMDQAATRELQEAMFQSISRAKLSREVIQEELSRASSGMGIVPGSIQTEGARVYSDRPVAAGLTKAAVGFLNATAGPESGGEYNVLYSPDGRRYFSDFSKHPNDPAVIPDGPNAGLTSSAAGRYQILYSTWVGAVQELAAQGVNIPDFSPASQDIVAWHIAKRDYKARTGLDLEVVLNSGDEGAILEAKSVLVPTWEGFGSMSDQAFLEKVSEATGNPTALMANPEYSHIPVDQRFAIIQDGMAQGQQIRARMAAEAEAQRNGQLETLRQGLVDGSGGMQEILTATERLRLSVAEQEEMLSLYEKNQTQRANAGKFIDAQSDPYFTFDPANAAHKDMMEGFFGQTQAPQRLTEGDEDFVNQLLLPTITQNKGYIPPMISSQLTQQMVSQNPQQATFALRTMAKLLAESPYGFGAAFDEQTKANVSLYNAMAGSMPQEELLNVIRSSLDLTSVQAREISNEIYKEAMRTSPEDFTPQAIAAELGADGVDFAAGRQLFAEFQALYTYNLSRTQDHGKARDAAIQQLGTKWGTSSVGGQTRAMMYPPEAMYGQWDGGFDWINRQAIEEFPALEGRQYELIADTQTAAEVAAGRPPSYKVVWFDENGMPNTMTYKDHRSATEGAAERAADPYAQIRWRPEITTDMQAEVFRRDNERRARREQMDSNFRDVQPPETMPEGYPKNYNEWRALSAEQKREFNLDITGLQAIRYFGVYPFNKLPQE